MRKPAFCICENKGANQLRSNCAADLRLCFHYIDFFYLIKCFTSTINSGGHVGTVSYLTTLFLGKPPGGSLLISSTHSFPSN